MTPKDVIQSTLGFSEMISQKYLADLSQADLLVRPVPGQNHIAWQVGHLILSERNMLEGVKPGASPSLPDGFEAGHGRDKTGVDDPSLYHPPETYLKLMAAQRAATKAALAEATDADLDAPAPETLRQMVPTVGGVYNLIGTHELMHVGQYVTVRRSLGKPIAI